MIINKNCRCNFIWQLDQQWPSFVLVISEKRIVFKTFQIRIILFSLQDLHLNHVLRILDIVFTSLVTPITSCINCIYLTSGRTPIAFDGQKLIECNYLIWCCVSMEIQDTRIFRFVELYVTFNLCLLVIWLLCCNAFNFNIECDVVYWHASQKNRSEKYLP
jgi:hypothetical protein